MTLAPARRILPLLLALALSACSGMPSLTPYKVEVQQGNYVTQDMVSKLKPGMTKDQVRYVLGTPLIEDPFHASRWDYVYLVDRGGKLLEERRLTVLFEGDKLVRLEGDVVPARPKEVEKQPAAGAEATLSGQPAATMPEGSAEKASSDKPRKEEKGFFGRMLEKIGL